MSQMRTRLQKQKIGEYKIFKFLQMPNPIFCRSVNGAFLNLQLN